jgi:hypothetical protein
VKLVPVEKITERIRKYEELEEEKIIKKKF